MKIRIEKNDMIKNNIEVSRTLVNEALFISDEKTKAKKLFMAYKGIEQTLKLLGVDPRDAFE